VEEELLSRMHALCAKAAEYVEEEEEGGGEGRRRKRLLRINPPPPSLCRIYHLLLHKVRGKGAAPHA